MKITVRQDLIRELRVNMGWTQEKLAEVSSVHSRTIQRIENDGVASMQSLNAIAGAFEVEPGMLQYIDAKVADIGQQVASIDYNNYRHPSIGSTTMSFRDRQDIKRFAKEAERMENWLMYKWVGWAVLFMGGFLTVSVLLMTQASLNKFVLLNVFFPGIAIGIILMLIGTFGIHLSNRATREQMFLNKVSHRNGHSIFHDIKRSVRKPSAKGI